MTLRAGTTPSVISFFECMLRCHVSLATDESIIHCAIHVYISMHAEKYLSAAFDLVMAMSDYGHAGTTVGWDEQINSKREGAVFKMDINDGLPGWYVYYDMYGWC